MIRFFKEICKFYIYYASQCIILNTYNFLYFLKSIFLKLMFLKKAIVSCINIFLKEIIANCEYN